MALIDDITIKVKAGDGGTGGRSFKTNYGSIKSYADGGNGGNGGNIYFDGSSNIHDLSEFRFKKVIEAPDGERGMNKNLDGKYGEDITVLVPLGTTIINTQTQNTVEILEENYPILVAKGGVGMNGNRDGGTSISRFKTDPEKLALGEEKELHLILSLIADIGLIGFPNAGKSSLLKTMTRALPKIGNYPFTTLEPNLGTLPNKRIVIADIPGLVEGASQGKGLGIQFLKHIQKTKILAHCIDGTSQNPYEDYKTVRSEFEEYDKTLLDKKEIILLTKIDLLTSEEIKNQVKKLKKTKKEILEVSIYKPESIKKLEEKFINEIALLNKS